MIILSCFFFSFVGVLGIFYVVVLVIVKYFLFYLELGVIVVRYILFEYLLGIMKIFFLRLF